ncbi:MAG: ABC transporter ATP-binding protein [Candidatus Geothermincolia bacterium]
MRRFGHFTAVDGLDLKIKKGEIYGLLGPNGAGKTTTIKMLCGLLQPHGGEAVVLGRRVPDPAKAACIGYMPQDTALYTGLTVHQNLQFYGELFGLRNARLAERELELLHLIHLEAWRNELVRNLSGGMRHRVSLACSLIHEPKVLFLDEPTVGVDPELRWAFWDFFRDLKGQGVTLLVTTHYMDEASRCDRVGFMRNGRLIAEGGPADLLAASGCASLEDAFIKFARSDS